MLNSEKYCEQHDRECNAETGEQRDIYCRFSPETAARLADRALKCTAGEQLYLGGLFRIGESFLVFFL